MNLAVADPSATVQTQNIATGERGKVLQDILKLAYLLEMGQASPSSQVSSATSSPPSGVNAAALVSGALALAPQLVAAGKGVVAVLASTGPVGWIAGGVALSVAAFFIWRDRRRRQWLASQGDIWWELELRDQVQPFIRQCFSSSFFPRFSSYWNGQELQLWLSPLSSAGPWRDLGLRREHADKRVVPYVIFPLLRRGSNAQQIGALHDASPGLPGFAYCRAGRTGDASIFLGQAYENAPAQFFAATLAPSDASLFQQIGTAVGPSISRLMQWSVEYHSAVSDRLARLEDMGFPVLLYSPGDSDTTAYEHFAKSATMCALAFWAGCAGHNKVSHRDFENIWMLGTSHSYRHNGMSHPIRTAGGVYLLCLAAASAGIDLRVVEDYLAGRRNDLPISVVSAASTGSSLSQSGSNVVSSSPSYSSSNLPQADSPGSSSSGSSASSSSFNSSLVATAAAFMAAVLFLRKRK